MWQWQFSPEYGGVWVEAVSEDGAPMSDRTLKFHTLETDPQRYVALQDIFRQLPDPAPDSADCEQMMTDMAYGTVRLTRGATTTEIAWNSGCMDEDYAEFLALLREADQMVSQWGREAPVSRTEPSRQ